MGLTKQYLRYESRGFFNVIASAKCNVIFITWNGIKGRFVAVGACENVFIWDLRQGEKVFVYHGDKSEVCVIATNSKETLLTAGYQDGSIKVFDLRARVSECLVTFQGHKSTITSLAYDQDGLRLLSGSKDSEIILWDIVNEAGLFRLKGHKGVVTQCRFLSDSVVVTTSLDSTVKFWDLDIQHCFKTLIEHRCEVNDIVVLNNGTRIITGAADSNLRGWNINFNDKDTEYKEKRVKLQDEDEAREGETESDIITCTSIGSIIRQSKSRLSNLIVDKHNELLASHGTDRILEIYRFLSPAERKKKLAKKTKKAKKETTKNSEAEDSSNSANISLDLKDEIKKIGFIKLSSKIKCFDIDLNVASNIAKFIVLTGNNSLESYEVQLDKSDMPSKANSTLTRPGHQTDVRCLCFSSDNTALLSASGNSLKIWNRETEKCIRTFECDYALTAFFVPGDRHCLIGTKSGKLQLFDIATSDEIPNDKGHEGAVWSVCLTPDLRGFASGSADKSVKFWEFELVSDSKRTTCKQLGIVHTRTLQLEEDVLCVRFSKDNRLIAVALLDSTVKVFFVDTLKFFLSLYGHKFPVLCMDISDDSTLIATGSSDKSVKLWGLDFGDCHKSIFAHDDSIMCLQFIPKTHMFFTGGKDGAVKQWDGDNFQRISTLKGHHAEIWGLAVSPSGHFLASASHDKSIRLWEKSDEIIVLGEEKEMEREEEFENALSQKDETLIAGEVNKETGLPSKRSAENLKAADRLIESLDIYKEEREKLEEYRQGQLSATTENKKIGPPPLHPLMVAYNTPTADHFIMHILKQIKSSELEEALLFLPFSYVEKLINVLATLIDKGWNIELCCRCLFFLLRIHHGQITSNEVLLRLIDKLRITTLERVHHLRDTLGFNLAGLKFLSNELESKEELKLFLDASQRFEEKSKKKKRKEKLLQRAILTNH